MKSQLYTPLLILAAGILVAASIVFVGRDGGSDIVANTWHVADDRLENTNSNIARNVREVSEGDHVYGSRSASVFIVEYSDFECPFCARLHPTLKRVVDDYKGEVALVYRHLPLTSIHSRSERAAVASECVADLAGNDAFWGFVDILIANHRQLNNDLYEESALSLGITKVAFQSCMESEEPRAKVSKDSQNAVASGGRGTPFSILLDAQGNPFPFSGALPYEQVRSLVDQALSVS